MSEPDHPENKQILKQTHFLLLKHTKQRSKAIQRQGPGREGPGREGMHDTETQSISIHSLEHLIPTNQSNKNK